MDQRRCYGCMQLVEGDVCPHCGYPASGNNEAHQLPAGTVLRGQYVVGKVLGQGGFGITYLGWDNHLDTAVCIKEYYPNHAVSRDCTVTTLVHCHTEQGAALYAASKERFLREAKTLAQFRDIPEIVGIYGFFEENNTVYIVMEYIKGMDLAHYVGRRGGRLSADETFRILRPIMQALAQVHRSELVHRDIAPDNIMLHPRGGAKLLDFGAARVVEDAGVDKGLNRSTEAIVKHGFAPMEQYQTRGNLGPWTDVYAMCASIYYCLTGQVPPEATTRMMGEAELNWDQISDLTPRQRAALEKGMAILARDRYSSMDELMEGLFGSGPVAAPMERTVPVSVSRPASPVQMAPPTRKEKKKGKGGLIALVCVLTAALVLCVGLLLGSGLISFGKPSPALEAGFAPVATEAPAMEAPAAEAPAAEAPRAEALPYIPFSTVSIICAQADPRTDLFVDVLLQEPRFQSTGLAVEVVIAGSNDISLHEEAFFMSIAEGAPIIWQLPEDPDMAVFAALCETAEASEIPVFLTGAEPGGYGSKSCDAVLNNSMVCYVGSSSDWDTEAAQLITQLLMDCAQGILLEDFYYMDGTVADETAEDGIFAIVSVQGLNIRSTPSTASEPVGNYIKGQVVEILQFQDVGGISWALTEDGWVVAQYLDIIE